MPLACTHQSALHAAIEDQGANLLYSDLPFHQRYDATALLDGAEHLVVEYTAGGQFASAKYSMNGGRPTFTYTRDLLASRYGDPVAVGSLGSPKYEWNLSDGLSISLTEAWPAGRVSLQYLYPDRYRTALRQAGEEDHREMSSSQSASIY
ncbi:hypothetical protein [Marinobacterium jannaschii]|uniref:hypothetical protein n=1 Tax=Marinobacterium jannaschii TaxID=64970 RepID=UPI0012EC9C6F|nr:hypothetical protein [Marinobacterium jannaschii]